MVWTGLVLFDLSLHDVWVMSTFCLIHILGPLLMSMADLMILSFPKGGSWGVGPCSCLYDLFQFSFSSSDFIGGEGQTLTQDINLKRAAA